MKLGRGGCLELVAVVVFAILFGAFAASTWFRYRGSDPESTIAAVQDSISAARAIERSRIRVEVRNGSGLEGAAGRMTEFLRERGFDVVDFGNADRFDHPRTFVIDRGGREGAAREVAAELRSVPIETAAESSPYLDVTVVVGRDLEAVLSRRSDEPSRSWWRRWLDKLP
ncbi:MAG: LytR C-terminal domain-containing protein [Gemmatimonadota bacterium]